jgi:hypothetical protein
MVHWLHARAVINDTRCFDSAIIAEKRQPARAGKDEREFLFETLFL